MKKTSRILAVLLSEVIALSCLWPSSTVMAQRVAAPLDKNDPKIRAVLAELEADIEKVVLQKIPNHTRYRIAGHALPLLIGATIFFATLPLSSYLPLSAAR